MTQEIYEALCKVVQTVVDDAPNIQPLYNGETKMEITENGDEIGGTFYRHGNGSGLIRLSINCMNFARLYSDKDGNNYTAYMDLSEEKDMYDLCKAVERATGERLMVEKFPFQKEGKKELYDISRRLEPKHRTERDWLYDQIDIISTYLPCIDRVSLVREGYNAIEANSKMPHFEFRRYTDKGYFDYSFMYQKDEKDTKRLYFSICEDWCESDEQEQCICIPYSEISKYSVISDCLSSYTRELTKECEMERD